VLGSLLRNPAEHKDVRPFGVFCDAQVAISVTSWSLVRRICNSR